MNRPVVKLTGSRRAGPRLFGALRLGPLRLWDSEPLTARTKTGRRRRSNSGWSIDLFSPPRRRR